MIIVKTKIELNKILTQERKNIKSLGFVPTMGALHSGHLSLIQEAQKKCDYVVCSIFVNPTQFNDPADLIKYPRPLEDDIRLLEQANCSLLFLPEVSEMYKNDEDWFFDLGPLEERFEGAMRPGHFQGVTQIVYKLFKAVEPDFAFFGQKDLQQCKVIEMLIRKKELPIELVICPIIREKTGLALSSRNVRLSAGGLQTSLALSHILQETKKNFQQGMSWNDMQNEGISFLKDIPEIEYEYFAIVNAFDLSEPMLDPSGRLIKEHSYVAVVAAWVDGVRLIDNLFLN